ncbi:hypothetical protein AVDCRST_MAG94-1153 [uncultured Leptolyngbya sp.]|uniref:Uncharacterized protein n=1 Tax=uncultured Leptolyngbya sp. TaxID=332963 RepID=A0A6J4KTA2_9CYAN|nr:hypothetical protein AVDCRST_MAG94-1153 [uncultured Leptolyngbya sp.]
MRQLVCCRTSFAVEPFAVKPGASIAAATLSLNALQNTIHPTDMKNVITK